MRNQLFKYLIFFICLCLSASVLAQVDISSGNSEDTIVFESENEINEVLAAVMKTPRAQDLSEEEKEHTLKSIRKYIIENIEILDEARDDFGKIDIDKAVKDIMSIAHQQDQESYEGTVVSSVNMAIIMNYADQVEKRNVAYFPKVLDNAKEGACAAANVCFNKVMKEGIATGGWEKIDNITYKGSAGNIYIYDSQTGRLKE